MWEQRWGERLLSKSHKGSATFHLQKIWVAVKLKTKSAKKGGFRPGRGSEIKKRSSTGVLLVGATGDDPAGAAHLHLHS